MRVAGRAKIGVPLVGNGAPEGAPSAPDHKKPRPHWACGAGCANEQKVTPITMHGTPRALVAILASDSTDKGAKLLEIFRLAPAILLLGGCMHRPSLDQAPYDASLRDQALYYYGDQMAVYLLVLGHLAALVFFLARRGVARSYVLLGASSIGALLFANGQYPYVFPMREHVLNANSALGYGMFVAVAALCYKRGSDRR